MTNRTVNYGVREQGGDDRGYARFVALQDARDFVRLVSGGVGEILDFDSGKVVK